MKAVYFPSRKDLLLGLFIWGVLGGAFFFVIKAMLNEPKIGPTVFTLLLFTGVIIGIGLMWFGTGYKVTEAHLLIYVGPFQYLAIPLTQIRSLRRSRTWVSSPANSLTRIRVGYGKRSEVFISPQREQEFVKVILAANPDVEVDLPS